MRIHLLGGFLIEIDGIEIPLERFRLRKARNLVKLLALAPAHRLHREQLMELLWPESDPDLATNNLNQALFAARRALSHSESSSAAFLINEGDNLSLGSANVSTWIDVEAFEGVAAFARREKNPVDFQSALELYTGDLLPEDLYEDWVAGRREALRLMYLGLLLELGRIYETRGDYSLGVDVLQQLVQADPANEEAYTSLMRLYALNGQRQYALRQYQVLQGVLQRELGIEPESGSSRLFKDIQSGKYPPTGQGKPSAAQTALLHNLPSPLSSFIGRQVEITQLITLLEGSRLVTLIGSGGVGKTRLSLQVAEKILEEFPDGVWYVELAPVIDPDLVPQAVATALGLIEETTRPLMETISHFLRNRHALLLLDNCEHLLDTSASLIDALLRKCPGLKFMVSSREPFGISGESIFIVPSLATPDPRHMPPLAEFLEFEAVRLFNERGRAVLPTFQIDEHNSPAIANICHRLDGIPLALELAAARLNLLTPEQLVSRLDDAFRMLTGGSRTALPRHQTLRATIDWSYRLLSEGEEELFRHLSVFAGGANLEAIEEICSDRNLMKGEVLNLLNGLVNKSMVRVEYLRHSETRYRLLETVRQYAHEKLNDAGESAHFHDLHLDYYLCLAEAIEPQLKTSSAFEKLELLNRELDNIRASLSWALDGNFNPRTERGLRLASALFILWQVQYFSMEGHSWLKTGLSVLPHDKPDLYKIRADACFAAGFLLFNYGRDLEVQEYLEESLEIYCKIGDAYGQVMVESSLGENIAWVGSSPSRAKALCRKSVETAKTLNDPWLLAWALSHTGHCANLLFDFPRAIRLLVEAMAIFEKLGDQLQVGWVRMSIGGNFYQQGNYSEARKYLTRGLVTGQTIQSAYMTGRALALLGEVDCMLNEFGLMEEHFQLALDKFKEGDYIIPVLYSLRGLGIALKHLGRPQEAANCYLESLQLALEANDRYGIFAAMAGIAGSSILLCNILQTVRLLGAVEAMFATYIKPLDRWELREFNCDVSIARIKLPEEIFTNAWTEGQAMTLELAVQEAQDLAAEIWAGTLRDPLL